MTISSPVKAVWLLIFVCMIWGLMFVLVDQTIEHLPVHSFHAFRFGIAALCLLPLWKLDPEAKGVRLSKDLLLPGLGLGLIMFTCFATQTLGMQHTTVSNTGFITGLCVPLVPIIGLLLFRAKVKAAAWLGVLCTTVGIYFLTVGDSLTFNRGDSLVLIAAVFFALHIVVTGRVAPNLPLIPLCTIQMAAVSLYSAIAAVVSEPIGENTLAAFQHPIVWITIITSGVLATALAFWAQTASQRLLEPYKVGLIFATEPLFTHVAAALILGERLGGAGWLGAGLIIGGMLVAELSDRRHPPKMSAADMNAAPDFSAQPNTRND
ncbi:DMT family transporter [Porticoccus sp. W117]|uniref:DMT family transporter n=1 Tax=Porticoccus sp. W117 TaxID=3054777 RepID=UPI0025925CE2|nr:DMT family transporter [Porticoccus sp. W117]MDM3871219.1 DMT family transporter [Porticoccus sp. W117]